MERLQEDQLVQVQEDLVVAVVVMDVMEAQILVVVEVDHKVQVLVVVQVVQV